MITWTPEAERVVYDYLNEVARLAALRGEDGEELQGNLFEHIRSEVAARGYDLVTEEQIRQIIALLGAPDDVVGDSGEGAPVSPPPAKPAVASPPPQPPPRGGIRWRSPVGCLIAVIVSVVVVFIIVPVLLTVVAIALPNISRSREAARRASCANNLKQMGLLFMMYDSEHGGQYPRFAAGAGNLFPEPEQIYPEYLVNPDILICPSDSDRTDREGLELLHDESYYYFGYVVQDEAELNVLADSYRQALASGATFGERLPADGGDAGLPALGSANLTDAHDPSKIPVMMDRLGNHIPEGCNVLYMDAHVRFQKLGEWPVTEAAFAVLESIDAAK